MNQYKIEYLLNDPLCWKQAINGDQIYDAVITGLKLSKIDRCEYRVRQGDTVIALFNRGEVLQDDSGIYKIGDCLIF